MQSQVSGKRLLCSKVWHQLLSCISSQGAWVTDPRAGALAAGSSGSASENPRRFLGWSLIVRPFQIKYNRGSSNPLGTSHVTRCLLHGFEAVKATIQKSCALPSIKQHRLGPFRAPRAPRDPRSSPSLQKGFDRNPRCGPVWCHDAHGTKRSLSSECAYAQNQNTFRWSQLICAMVKTNWLWAPYHRTWSMCPPYEVRGDFAGSFYFLPRSYITEDLTRVNPYDTIW